MNECILLDRTYPLATSLFLNVNRMKAENSQRVIYIIIKELNLNRTPIEMCMRQFSSKCKVEYEIPCRMMTEDVDDGQASKLGRRECETLKQKITTEFRAR